MLKLNVSSSNQITFQPSPLSGNGSSYLVKFTDTFSEDEYVAQATGSNYGQWVRLFVDITGSYVIGINKSSLPLYGGTFDVNVYDGAEFAPQWDIEDVNWELENINWEDVFAVFSIYGSEPRKWKLMGNTWSSVPGIPTTTGDSIMTTRAWVSESIDRTNYSSANENAAYVVYQG